MSPFITDSELERRAASMWQRNSLDVGFNVEVLIDDLDLGLVWDALPPDRLAEIVPARQMITINKAFMPEFDKVPGLLRFTLAHEIGHWELHSDADRPEAMSLFDEGGRILCREEALRHSKAPAEIQADRFASYLLAPTDRLKARLPNVEWKGWRPVIELANEFAISQTAMIVRLEKERWAYRDESGVPHSGVPKDPRQLTFI